MYPLVSVICNGQGIRSSAINMVMSILNQDYPSIEIFADKHIYGILKQKKAYETKGISICALNNQSVSAFRNEAIKKAKGKYICFLSAPTILASDKLTRQVEHLENHTDIYAVLGGETFINQKGEILSLPVFVETDPEYIPFALLTGYQISLYSVLFETDKVLKDGLQFDDTVNSDINFISAFSNKYPVSGIQGECIKSLGESKSIIISQANKNRDLAFKADDSDAFSDGPFLQRYNMRLAYRNSLIRFNNKKNTIRRKIDSVAVFTFGITPTMYPLVSVIIPTYNRSKRLSYAIESVLRQTYKNIEIIVVDDCSIDDTADIVANLQKNNKMIHYYRLEKNGGPAIARNYGVEKAHGEYIAFHDDDDEWFCDKLDIQISRMLYDKTIDMTFGQMARFHGNSLINFELSSFDWYNRKGDFFQEELRNNYIGTPTIVIKKEAFQRLGGFCAMLNALEDWEFAIRASKTLKIEFINTPLMEVNVLDTSVTRNVRKNTSALLYIIQQYYVFAEDGAELMNLYKKHFLEMLKNSNQINIEIDYIREQMPKNLFDRKLAEELFFDMDELRDIMRLEELEKTAIRDKCELQKQYERNKELTVELQNQSKRNDMLTAELKSQSDRNDTLTAELKSQSDRNDTLTAELKSQSDRNDTLTAELKSQSDRNDTLTAELKSQSDRNDTLTAELKSQNDRNNALTKELQNQSDRNDDLTAEVQNQMNRNEELFQELKRQYEKNKVLTQKLRNM